MRIAAMIFLGFSIVSAVLTGCSSSGPVDNPVARNLTWFSFLNGDDLRKLCRPGVGERYRFIYNGTFNNQVRVYEVTLDDDGRGAMIDTLAIPRAALNQWFITPDPFSPWNGEKSLVHVDRAQFDALVAAADADGLGGPVPTGEFLRSDDFYWVAIGCRDGEIVFNAWANGTPRFAKLTFPEILFADDRADVPIIRPYDTNLPPFGAGGPSSGQYFRLQVGRDGLG